MPINVCPVFRKLLAALATSPTVCANPTTFYDIVSTFRTTLFSQHRITPSIRDTHMNSNAFIGHTYGSLTHTHLRALAQVSAATLSAFTCVRAAYFWNSHSRLSSGHTCRVLSHLEMQWKWKACYGAPNTDTQERRPPVRMAVRPLRCRCTCWRSHVANAPRHGALVRGGRRLVGLALDTCVRKRVTNTADAGRQERGPSSVGVLAKPRTEVHDVVPADGAVVHDNVCL